MTLGIPNHTHARVAGVTSTEILKVLTAGEFESGAWRAEDVLIWARHASGAILTSKSRPDLSVAEFRDDKVVSPGDVIRLRPGGTMVSVLHRRGARGNALLTTERCNSRCLMCSQPPRDEDDSWRLAELLRVISLIDPEEPQIGFTGGEPTLLGDGLAQLLGACRTYLPSSEVQVLTNGRTFRSSELAHQLVSAHPSKTTWAVPLYADVAALHDEIVDSVGAFDETLQGLYELGRLGARIEIRVVLHALSVPRLPQLAAFIYRRLPFVSHVALMGLEPMGLAKGNRDRLWIDPADYQGQLTDALFHLAHRGVPVSLYNLPLCILDRALWPYARQSISEWKNAFPSECAACVVRDHCSGFFASAGPTWRSHAIAPLSLKEFAA